MLADDPTFFGRSQDLLTQIKLALMRGIDASLRRQYRIQEDAARALGVDRNRLSNLRNGHTDRFSLPWLIITAERIGAKVTITIE